MDSWLINNKIIGLKTKSNDELFPILADMLVK